MTMIKSASERKILLDGDVISHFIKGDLFPLLDKLYHKRLIIINIVKNEIYQRKGWDKLIEELIKKFHIEEITFPEETDYIKEYAHLTSEKGHGLGKGESACMVYCRFNNKILASSNLRDIVRYCKNHNIDYITTADILLEAYTRGQITEMEGNTFISKIKSKKSRFPFENMYELITNSNFSRFAKE